jgi:hypothetical protein
MISTFLKNIHEIFGMGLCPDASSFAGRRAWKSADPRAGRWPEKNLLWLQYRVK